MKLRKNDTVIVLRGKDKGKEGVVEKVYIAAQKVLVKDINKFKKHVKKSEAFPQGGIVEVNRPMDVSKVKLVCPQCKKPARVGYEIGKDGKKRRMCKQCKKVI